MTIHWRPIDNDIDPDSIELWHIDSDGERIDFPAADVSQVSGMPDSEGGVAPNAVKQSAVDAARDGMTVGNGTVMSKLAGEIMLDMLASNYECQGIE